MLVLLSIVAGGFGEGYVPSQIVVSGDPAATADRFRALGTMFRLGFAGYLVEAMCDISLALVFYVLLKPVRRNLALLSAFFGLVGTAVFAGAEAFFLAANLSVSGVGWLAAFSSGQLNTLAMVLLKLYAYGGVVSILFYGVATTLRGYLIVRSQFLPAWLGLLMLLGGVAFIVRAFAAVLVPGVPSSSLLMLMAPAGLALTVWMLVRGVDVAKWEMAMASHEPPS